MNILIDKIESKKFPNHFVCTLNNEYVVQNIEEILQRYFEKEYCFTNFKMKEIWKKYSSDDSWVKMVAGESLLHFYLFKMGNQPAFGKGFEINTANKIPISYDALAFGKDLIIIGESKYIKSKSNNISKMVEDYNKSFRRNLSHEDSNIIWTTFLDHDMKITKEEMETIQKKTTLLGIYEDQKCSEIKFLENKIDAIAKYNIDIVHEWLFIANSEFEELVIMIKEFFNE